MFVDETYVGGYPEFKQLYRRRQLQKMLTSTMALPSSPHCKDCKQEEREERRRKKEKMEQLLKEEEEELMFANNMIGPGIPLMVD